MPAYPSLYLSFLVALSLLNRLHTFYSWGPTKSLPYLGNSCLLLKYTLLAYCFSKQAVPSIGTLIRASVFLSYVIVSLARIWSYLPIKYTRGQSLAKG